MSDFFNYSQPDFFRFGHDSVWLAELAFMQNMSATKGNILDIGAGCGIVGLELWLKFSSANWHLHSIEPLFEFKKYWEDNKAKVEEFSNLPLNASYFSGKFQDYNVSELKFDLIVGNLPYFEKGKGRLSPDGKRNKCRFMEEGLIDDLYIFLEMYLVSKGRSYFVWKTSGLELWNPFFESSVFIASCLAKRDQECIIEIVRC